MADRIFPEETLSTRTLGDTGLATSTPEGQFTLARNTAGRTGATVLSLASQIRALLEQFRQQGYVGESQGIQEQVQRGTAPLPADLAGAQLSPEQILGFRSGEVRAIQPTIGGARQLVEETEQGISKVNQLINQYQENQIRVASLQQQQKSQLIDDSRAIFNTAVGAGSEPVRGIIKNNPDILKNIGITSETAEAFAKGLENQEKIKAAQQNEISFLRNLASQQKGEELGLGTPIKGYEKLGDVFNRATAGTAFTINDRLVHRRTLENMLAEGDISGAKEFIKDLAISGIGTEGYKQYTNRNTAIKNLENLNRDLKDYLAKGGTTNIFVGSLQDVLRKLGTTQNKELASIEAKIKNSLIAYRRNATGVQFSLKEQQQYEELFPRVKNVEKFNQALIGALLQTMQSENETTLKQRLGEKGYKEVVGAQTQNTFIREGSTYQKNLDGTYTRIK